MGFRKWLVILKTKRNREEPFGTSKVFSVKSDEAQTESEALALARKRYEEAPILCREAVSELETGGLVLPDSDSGRVLAGISNEGYPEGFPVAA